MKKLTMLIGLPRSGKSTWVEQNRIDEVVISADDIRYLVYNQRFWAEGEALMWSIREIMLKYMLQQDIDIIIDETNITKSIRKKIIKLANKYEYNIVGNLFVPNKKICIERAKLTNQEDLIPVLEKMNEQFEIPELSEGFNIINSYDKNNEWIGCVKNEN